MAQPSKPIRFARAVVLLAVGACLSLAAIASAPAFAQTPAPWWGLTSGSRPSVLPAKGEAQIFVVAQNLGNASSAGKITISDQLPPGLTPIFISGVAGGPQGGGFDRGPVNCVTKTLTCTFEKNEKGEPGFLPPFEVIEMRITVQVTKAAEDGALNTATVSGGGAGSSVSASHPLKVGTALQFGIDDYSLIPEEQGGLIDTQAGSHPFQLTSVVTLNSQGPDPEDPEKKPRTVALPKDVIAELPAGLVGNPTPFAQCTDAQFAEDIKAKNEGGEQTINACPASSAIGVATVTVNEPADLHFTTLVAPIFNMVPREGEPVRFGFKAAGIVTAFLDTSVRTGGDYGVTVSSLNIPQVAWLLSAKLSFWGVPGDPEHDHQRGWQCLQELGGPGACPATNPSAPPPFLVMPTSCEAPFETSIRADSWAAPGKPSEVAEPPPYHLPQALDGCNRLPFSPEIRVTPDGNAASTPTGLNVDVHVPQDAVLKAESLAESAVRDITVALPEGVAVNPSGGDGLQACSEGLVGFTGYSELHAGSQTATFTPALPEPLQPGLNFCPDASKVGTVKIKVPILANALEGSVYLASQNENPFGSLVALYIVAKDPVSGVLIKLPGEVRLTPTGQVIGTFKNSPQAPFEDAELHFFGGERAPLGTPAHCGPYTTNASFTPWSGNEAVNSQSTFNITSGPNATPCPGQSLPFAPTLTAGTTNIQAGAFSTLTTSMNRQDGEQDIGAVQLSMAPGLSGILAGVKLCPEAQANEGACPAESQIGETTISAGLGADPVTVTGGKVYITEKYKGAPFGLAVVNPVKAGPFDLENTPQNHPACDCLVVRAKIDVDPLTAQLKIATDSEGPHAIPQMIEGIPVQLKHVNVTITRPGFTFNPTNCDPQSITGTIQSHEGASQAVSVPFQVTNCATLAFKPDFKVSTTAKTSKANGASLSVKLSYPNAKFGSQANISMVKVDLPKQLPSRLTTLQKACLAKTFEANRANCPAASIVGQAKVITPLLPVPLTGPAYFVSHGNEAFPNLTIILQGYGVTVELVGSTFIKNGITSSTFKATPDVPFNSFELTLPQGPFSALTANGDLCQPSKVTTINKRVAVKRKGRTIHVTKKVKHTSTTALVMPTDFVAQNGAQLHQNTKISVTGCTTGKKKAKKAKKRGKGGGKRR